MLLAWASWSLWMLLTTVATARDESNLAEGLKGVAEMLETLGTSLGGPGKATAPGGPGDRKLTMEESIEAMGKMAKTLSQDFPHICLTESEVTAPKMDMHVNLRANGCGPDGLKVTEEFGLHRCCNIHDVCFSVCGTKFGFCQKEFSRCMKKVCRKPLSGSKKKCRAKAKLFSSIETSEAANFHMTSQRLACDCFPDLGQATERHRDYLRSFLSEYNSSQADDQEMHDTLETWKGQEGELYLNLVKTYGHQFVRFEDEIEPMFYKDEL